LTPFFELLEVIKEPSINDAQLSGELGVYANFITESRHIAGGRLRDKSSLDGNFFVNLLGFLRKNPKISLNFFHTKFLATPLQRRIYLNGHHL